MSKFTLAELIEVVKDINNLEPPFETLLNAKETDVEKVIAEIKANAKELDPKDNLTNKSKLLISRLGVGPWIDFVLTDDEVDKVVDAEIEKQREPEQMTAKAEKKEVKKAKIELSRYGHRKGTMSGDIDDMVWQGVKKSDAVKTLAKNHCKTEKAALSKFLGHIKHLQKDLNLVVTIKEDHYKTNKATYEKPLT